MRTKAIRFTVTLAAAAAIGMSTTACNDQTTEGSGSSSSQAGSSGNGGSQSTNPGSGSTKPGTGNAGSNGGNSGGASLTKLANTTNVKSVKVANGYEAVSFNNGRIGVYTSANGKDWTQAATFYKRSYGNGAAGEIHAATLQDGHATFIVRGYFTGDDTGDFTVVSRSANGWGTLNLNTAHKSLAPYAGVNIVYDAAFQNGSLRTSSLWKSEGATFIEGKMHPIVRTFAPSGNGTFKETANNIHRGTKTKTATDWQTTPGQGDGSYLVQIDSVTDKALTFTPVDTSTCTDANVETCWTPTGGKRTVNYAKQGSASLVLQSGDAIDDVTAPVWAWGDLTSAALDGGANIDKYREGSSYVIPNNYTDVFAAHHARVVVKNGVITQVNSVYHP